jgi:hypothetical protein
MADTQSTVEILLNVKAQKGELEALQGELNGLKGNVEGNAAAMAKWRTESSGLGTGISGLATNVEGLSARTYKLGSDFAPATAAMRAASVATEAHSISTQKLSRDLGYIAQDMAGIIPGAQGVGREISYLTRDFGGLGAEIGVVNTLMAAAAVGGVIAFAAALASIVTKGIELQKTLQDVGEGVTGVLSTDSTKFGGGAAQLAGTAAVDRIVDVAKQAQIPISQLVKSFDQINPAATRANASIEQQIQLVAQLTAQSGALHIPQQRLIVDLEQLFNGQARNTNQLAQRLDLDKQTVVQAHDNGEITELLIHKTQEYAQAHSDAGDTIERAQQKVGAAFEQLAAAAAKPIIQPLTDALIAMANEMNDPAIQAGAAYIISQFEAIIAEIKVVIEWCQQVGKAIVAALQAAASFGAEVANAPASGQTLSSGAPISGGAAAADENPLFKSSRQLALEARGGGGATGSWEEIGATGSRLESGPQLSKADALALSNRLADQESLVRKSAQDQAQILSRQPGLQPPVAGGGGRGGGGRGGGGGGGGSQDKADQQQISEIQSEINAKTEQYKALLEQNTANHKLGLTTLNQEKDANFAATNTYITGIDGSIKKLEGMKAQIEAVGASQDKLNVKEQTQINNLDKAIAKMQLLKAQAEIANQDNSWMGQWTKSMIAFGDSLQLTGEKAAATFQGAINTGINSTSQALTGLIFQTKNWQQAFVSAAESIVQSLIKVALQAVIGQALQHGVNAKSILENAKTAASGAYASVSSIPLIGWILGPIVAAAAFAAVAAFGAFAEGGIVPGSPSASDNRLAMVASGEGIVTSRAVSYYGPQMIHAMNAMSFATGGVVGPGPGAGPSVPSSQQNLHFGFFDDRQALGKWMQGRDGRKIVVDHVRSSAREIGIPSSIG